MFKINPAIQQLATKLVRRFPAAEVFLVGGPVRDLLLGKEIKDYDLLVRNVPAKKLAAFLKTQGKVNLVGRSFGVYKLKLPATGYRLPAIDVALPRTEHSLHHTGGYRDFKVQSDYQLPLATDLSRRDFTINAMAYNLLTKKIADPFSGLEDLDKKIIRAVGQPEKRFKEDYSRLLRAIRFAVQLNFQIEKQTWAALKKLTPKINQRQASEFTVPRETIAKELLKAFCSNPPRALELLNQSGLIKQLMPELLKMKGCDQPDNWHTEGDVWQHTVLCLKNLNSKKFQQQFSNQPSINLILGLLFHDLGKPYTIQTPAKHGTDRIRFNEHDTIGAQKTKAICERLKLSAYKDKAIDCDPEKVTWLVQRHMLTVHGKIAQMKNTTLEKYFFSDRPGQDLLALIFVDALSTIPQKDAVYLDHYSELKARLQKLAKLQKIGKKILPRLILDGHEIMKILKIKPGPQIGQVMTLLREEQLKGKIKNKTQAKKFIKQCLEK
jgi:poly(A) polymerase